MPTTDHFSDYYKTITHTELLAILDNPADYQPAAIEAAKAELERRQLSEADILEARQPMKEKQLRKEAEREKLKAVEEKIKAAGTSFFDTINPLQQEIPSAEKMIRLTTLVFAGLFLYEVFSNFQLHLSNLKDLPRYPYELGVTFFFLLLLPVALFFLWKRKPLGWILLIAYLCFSIMGTLWLLFMAYTHRSSGYGILDIYLPTPSYTTYIIQLLFLGGSVYVLCRKNIREVLAITEDKMIWTISISLLISFFLVYGMS
jgi:hypothetical protein